MPVPRPVLAPRGDVVPVSRIGGYVLAMSWSPQYCASTPDPLSPRNRDQCGVTARYGWVLHGLWPQSDRGTPPRWCRPAKVVPTEILQRNFCSSPSASLMQQQWAKHGTCMSKGPAAYFATATTQFRAVKFPDMTALAKVSQNSSSIRCAFARANLGTSDAMFAVVTDAQGWLREVRLCLDVKMKPTACAAGQQGLLGQRRINIRR
jgi:ribonuclease T2